MIQLLAIMTTEVLTHSAERSVAEVTNMMVKARVGSAVVMEGSWLAGILTERDGCGRPPRVRTLPSRRFRSG